MERPSSLTGNLVNVHTQNIYPARLELSGGSITRIIRDDGPFDHYILPGFVDAHVHIESSMLPPSEFARLAVRHGTVATVSDPHEIANVLGVEGVRFMLEDADASPLTMCFGAPPCVPATTFETAGASLGVQEVRELLRDSRVGYLSEVMNVPGVLTGDEALLEKLAAAKALGKPLDGHAPGLRGESLARYVAAGISTDHESFLYEEGKEKLEAGLKLAIREGSAAKNFEALWPLLPQYPSKLMFCTDDLHPDDLEAGHIDTLVRRGLAKGIDLMTLLHAACVTPVEHYGLHVGLLREGDPADFIVVDDLERLTVLATYLKGQRVAEGGVTHLASRRVKTPNRFATKPKKLEDFHVAAPPAAPSKANVIVASDGQLVTRREVVAPKLDADEIVADIENDVLKLTVVNRYEDAPPAVAFVRGFGLKRGAIASSVAHDSHNIIAVGTSDEALSRAVNLVIEQCGGLSCVVENDADCLALPIAGLMSDGDGFGVAARYSELSERAKALGSTLHAPYMTLSFMALLVIPELKLSDQGLFDGTRFAFTRLFE